MDADRRENCAHVGGQKIGPVVASLRTATMWTISPPGIFTNPGAFGIPRSPGQARPLKRTYREDICGHRSPGSCRCRKPSTISAAVLAVFLA